MIIQRWGGGRPGRSADCSVCVASAGWFFDWTQSYDLAFYFSGSCVLLGALVLSVLTLPCWTRRSGDGERPDIQYTSNCDKVACVA